MAGSRSHPASPEADGDHHQTPRLGEGRPVGGVKGRETDVSCPRGQTPGREVGGGGRNTKDLEVGQTTVLSRGNPGSTDEARDQPATQSVGGGRAGVQEEEREREKDGLRQWGDRLTGQGMDDRKTDGQTDRQTGQSRAEETRRGREEAWRDPERNPSGQEPERYQEQGARPTPPHGLPSSGAEGDQDAWLGGGGRSWGPPLRGCPPPRPGANQRLSSPR